MEEKINNDLAQGSFIEKWPVWLRWLLFIPSAIIVPALFFIIQIIFQTWFLDIGPNAFYLVLMRGLVYGAGFVFIGTFVAPKNQKVISLLLLIIMSMLVGIGIFSAYLMKSPIINIVEDLIMLASAGYANYYISHEIK